MRKSAVEAARCFVNEEFPNCDFAILAGSASRGEETPSSDLDIVIFDANSVSYRKSLVLYDWRIEAFIHNHQSYLLEFDREKQKGRPILGNMISEGIMLKDHEEFLQVKDNALQHVQSGPLPLTEEYIRASRYFIGDLLDDFIDAKSREEALITVNNLSLEIPDFILRLNNQWSGRGKGLTRALRSFDEKIYNEFFSSLNDFYLADNKQPFVDFVNKVYKPLGGFLFEGFSTRV
ncbi:nucleotidyltransferase domain-containing protein [Bacillus sp. KH172YL63]|uniref:nucleotidyltransferase domain-containing protein n=1 Tax=Bacillus sp. KH172YL63 TaxID=2709784 RepID=UPI0013E4E8C3|nr:nucleotidyltransferase domain-containing protein [Bacillus sp. KH172YL63]BCB05234.1 nucleotidyltransferase [Bacillus sp. KH172YL63]